MSAVRAYKSKIAANGQVVLPKELRDALGLKSGDTIMFCAEKKESGLLTVVLRKPSLLFSAMVGTCKKLQGRPLEEILRELDKEEML
jgi:AbrB family looped-hinge helix DNA binding protein